jgi:hypothetical protein
MIFHAFSGKGFWQTYPNATRSIKMSPDSSSKCLLERILTTRQWCRMDASGQAIPEWAVYFIVEFIFTGRAEDR